MPGVCRVPERTSRSWPPPCSSGVHGTSRPSTSAPAPIGPPSLCPVRVSASTPAAATSTGSAPTACTASVWNGTPYPAATAASSRDRLHGADLVVRPHHGDQRGRCPRPSASAAAQRLRVHPAEPVHRQPAHLGALVPLQPLHRVQHGVVLDRAGQHPAAARVGGPAGPEDALDREVVALGAAAGEDHLVRPGADGRGDPLPRLLDQPAGPPAGRVQRRRVAPVALRRRPPPRPPPAASAWSRRGRGSAIPVSLRRAAPPGARAVKRGRAGARTRPARAAPAQRDARPSPGPACSRRPAARAGPARSPRPARRPARCTARWTPSR